MAYTRYARLLLSGGYDDWHDRNEINFRKIMTLNVFSVSSHSPSSAPRKSGVTAFFSVFLFSVTRRLSRLSLRRIHLGGIFIRLNTSF